MQDAVNDWSQECSLKVCGEISLSATIQNTEKMGGITLRYILEKELREFEMDMTGFGLCEMVGFKIIGY
jgi:hypothetical protein